MFQYDQFALDTIQHVFDTDCLVTSHPLHSPVNTPADIKQLFSDVTYSKVRACLHTARVELGYIQQG
jgi:aminopeptidase N